MKKKGYISNSFVTWAKHRNIPVTYKTVVLVPYYDGYKNVLTQDMINDENIKYVIKYDYWLNGETITVPSNSILEFDGGTLHNGTIIGQDTFINDIGGLGLEKLFAEDIVREGTWRTNGGGSFEQAQSDWNQSDNTKPDFIKNKPTIPEGVIVDTTLSKESTNPVQNKVITEALEKVGNIDKSYDPTKHSGFGRKTLKLKEDDSNVLTQEDFDAANTIYVIQYDFVLGEDITVPENCVLEFDGGSLDNGTLIGNNTVVEANTDGIFGLNTILTGSFIGHAYPEWVKNDTDDVSLQINVLNGVVAEDEGKGKNCIWGDIYFKNKTYNLRTTANHRGNWVGESYNSKIVVHTPINTQFKEYYLELSNLHIVGNENIGMFTNFSNNININNCLVDNFDYLFYQNTEAASPYIGRIIVNNTRFERINRLDIGNSIVNIVTFNNCFINNCLGWFSPSTIYTSLSFNNCNIQKTDFINENITNRNFKFPSVSFNNCYLENNTFDFNDNQSFGSILFYACHFKMKKVIDSDVNAASSVSLENLIVTFDSCDFLLNKDISSGYLPQFNINNFILIKIVGSLNIIGQNNNGTYNPIVSINDLINNPNKLYCNLVKGLNGVWNTIIKYPDLNIDGTKISKVIFI